MVKYKIPKEIEENIEKLQELQVNNNIPHTMKELKYCLNLRGEQWRDDHK